MDFRQKSTENLRSGKKKGSGLQKSIPKRMKQVRNDQQSKNPLVRKIKRSNPYKVE